MVTPNTRPTGIAGASPVYILAVSNAGAIPASRANAAAAALGPGTSRKSGRAGARSASAANSARAVGSSSAKSGPSWRLRGTGGPAQPGRRAVAHRGERDVPGERQPGT